MRFERGIDSKKALKIGIPTYSIYRMQVFKSSIEELGFYIMSPKEIKETLEKLSRGELSRLNYVIEFSRQYEELENRVEIRLYELHTCLLRYHTKDYFIKSHIK